MYVCLENLNITNWPLHAYGKHLIRYYSQQLPPEAFGMPAEALPQRLGRSATAAAAAPSGGGNAASSNEGDAKKAPGSTVSTASGSATSSNSSAAGAAAAPNSSTVAAANSQAQAGSGSAAVSSPAVLNVVFHKRTSDRFLLNAAELLEACNAWRYTTPGGVEVRSKCWEVSGCRRRGPVGRGSKLCGGATEHMWGCDGCYQQPLNAQSPAAKPTAPAAHTGGDCRPLHRHHCSAAGRRLHWVARRCARAVGGRLCPCRQAVPGCTALRCCVPRHTPTCCCHTPLPAANMANGWLMRPGSSVVELTMYEFEASGAHHQYPKRNMLVSGRAKDGVPAGWTARAVCCAVPARRRRHSPPLL